MNTRSLTMAAILAGGANLAIAQLPTPADSYFPAAGWAASESPYPPVSREMEIEFLNRTKRQPSYSPQSFNAVVGDQLDRRLNQQLRSQLDPGVPHASPEVDAY